MCYYDKCFMPATKLMCTVTLLRYNSVQHAHKIIFSMTVLTEVSTKFVT